MPPHIVVINYDGWGYSNRGGDIVGISGSSIRPVECAKHPRPLARCHSQHPYMIAIWDLNDRGSEDPLMSALLVTVHKR